MEIKTIKDENVYLRDHNLLVWEGNKYSPEIMEEGVLMKEARDLCVNNEDDGLSEDRWGAFRCLCEALAKKDADEIEENLEILGKVFEEGVFIPDLGIVIPPPY